MRLVRPLRAAARKAVARVVARDPRTARPLQVAALPWRRSKAGGVEVLLVTSRGSGRWLLPKGWPMVRRTRAEAAAREAFEEAGVRGRVREEEIGRFEHRKKLPLLGPLRCTVVVFPLEVERQLDIWPERKERKRRWFPLKEAAGRIQGDELRSIVRKFGRSYGA